MTFVEDLQKHWSAGRHVCLGLDPTIDKLPERIRSAGADGVIEFNTAIIEATADLVAAYKPQSAYYERLGLDGPRVLKATIDVIKSVAPTVPVILDAKRGDIGATNDAYVETIFDFYNADAVTVAPYLGPEAMKPFTDRGDRGVIVLCRTSNPGADRYQHLDVDGEPLYVRVAQDVATAWNHNGNCGLVVGATAPSEMKRVRQIAPDLPILVPGIGTQGGDLAATIQAGRIGDSMPLLISSSRDLIYAYNRHPDLDWATATRQATTQLHSAITELKA